MREEEKVQGRDIQQRKKSMRTKQIGKGEKKSFLLSLYAVKRIGFFRLVCTRTGKQPHVALCSIYRSIDSIEFDFQKHNY